MIPAAFRNRRTLAILNVAAVGSALAAATAAAFNWSLRGSGEITLVVGLPTLILGTIWAALLRLPHTVGKSSFRLGWVSSVPLAALNAALAAGIMFTAKGAEPTIWGFVSGAVLGALVGAIIWIPAVILTLLCFGVPIAWAQRLAKKGLAGEERGEWIVGLACLGMSALSGTVWLGKTWTQGALGIALTAVAALLASSSTALAVARERRRRSFVQRVEAGREPGYRIDATDDGKVLVRFQENRAGYRVADFEEEVYDLSAEGEATREKTLDPVHR